MKGLVALKSSRKVSQQPLPEGDEAENRLWELTLSRNFAV